MSDITFVEVDAQKINSELINDFETSLGETLYPGDERRIFLEQETQVLVGIENNINETAKQNLLRYAKGEQLDALGEWWNTPRLDAAKSHTTFRFTLSAIQNQDIPVPSGTRGTPDGTLYFASSKDIVIPSGYLYADVLAEALEAGEKYNNFVSGQIKTLVDPIPYVASVTNIDTSIGGADIEPDDDGVNIWSGYRERIREAPEATSTAGPEGAYICFAKAADINITDIAVTSPSPGVVKITILMKDGEIPSQDILDKVFAECSPKERRPLTDNVQVGAPTIVNYDINLTYYLDKEHSTEELSYRKVVEGENLDCITGAIREYINWQQSKLGRAINPDELRYRIQNTASYTTIDNKSYTVVRKIVLNLPTNIILQETEVAKVGTITVTYGGLE